MRRRWRGSTWSPAPATPEIGFVHIGDGPLLGGRLFLANSITLTPGTLSIDIVGDRILVHWIDCPPGTDLVRATKAISESFERHISGFLK